MVRGSTLIIPALFIALGLLSSGNAVFSRAEFEKAVTSNGYPKPRDSLIYTELSRSASKYSREELAMFLAQLIHESGGFQYREEIACKVTKCPGQYRDNVGLPGRYYYGRGFIQLTWGANYRAASFALGLGDRLLQNPDLVTAYTRNAVDVSRWFWDVRVRPALGGTNQFGRTTRAINGGECTNPSLHPRAQNRWRIYLNVAKALKITNKAKENGCYN